MLAFALGIGVISYIIFALGIVGLYNFYVLLGVFVCSLIFFSYVFITYNSIKSIKGALYSVARRRKEPVFYSSIFIGVMLLFIFINALAPERGFDALWYHLVIPKFYLANHGISYIPGSLLYYSAMPKLADLLFVVPLALKLEVLTRLISFAFGILTLIVTFFFARKFAKNEIAILAVVILISHLVFSWQASTAYIDMARTFFETVSLFAFFQWIETQKKSLFIESALCMGLAIATKLLAFFSLFSMILLILYYFGIQRKFVQSFKAVLVFVFISILVPLPWLLFAYVNTANPFFPFFTKTYSIGVSSGLLNPIRFVNDIVGIFSQSPDPISPIFLMSLPLLFLYFKKLSKNQRLFVLYSLFCIFGWYFAPRTGGGRFMLPYLPILSIASIFVFSNINSKAVKGIMFVFIAYFAVIAFVVKTESVIKVAPVVFGFQSKDEFLNNNLNFSYGDMYDTDGALHAIINKSDVVLIYGVHNLYYLDFPYIHESWVKKGDQFNYILTQHSALPERFWFFKNVYENKTTGVRLYSGEGFWEY